MHPTDQKILDALSELQAKNMKVTTITLAAASGVTPRTVKKRKLRMIAKGTWPGRIGISRYSQDIVNFIQSQDQGKYTYKKLANLVNKTFDVNINPKTVERIRRRPLMLKFDKVTDIIKEEALREYYGRRSGFKGQDVCQLIRAARGS
jgi:hypothetical protein